jgi:hypothetical protein
MSATAAAAVLMLATGARAAPPAPDYFSTEAIIRRNGFACGHVTATRDDGTAPIGRVFRVTCDGRLHYRLVFPPDDRPSYVVVDRP